MAVAIRRGTRLPSTSSVGWWCHLFDSCVPSSKKAKHQTSNHEPWHKVSTNHPYGHGTCQLRQAYQGRWRKYDGISLSTPSNAIIRQKSATKCFRIFKTSRSTNTSIPLTLRLRQHSAHRHCHSTLSSIICASLQTSHYSALFLLGSVICIYWYYFFSVWCSMLHICSQDMVDIDINILNPCATSQAASQEVMTYTIISSSIFYTGVNKL